MCYYEIYECLVQISDAIESFYIQKEAFNFNMCIDVYNIIIVNLYICTIKLL